MSAEDSGERPGLDLLRGLNRPQQDAVTTVDGPVLVLAGPGSGKCVLPTTRMFINDQLMSAEDAWSKFGAFPTFDGEGWIAEPKEALWIDSFNQLTGRFERASIAALYRQFIREPIRLITLRDGSHIGITAAHHLFDGCQWTSHIRPGDVLALPGRLPQRTQPLDVELAELLGWLVGAGYERVEARTAGTLYLALHDEDGLMR